jgi:hypothetical protein
MAPVAAIGSWQPVESASAPPDQRRSLSGESAASPPPAPPVPPWDAKHILFHELHKRLDPDNLHLAAGMAGVSEGFGALGGAVASGVVGAGQAIGSIASEATHLDAQGVASAVASSPGELTAAIIFLVLLCVAACFTVFEAQITKRARPSPQPNRPSCAPARAAASASIFSAHSAPGCGRLI